MFTCALTTKKIKSSSVGLAVVQVLLCQVDSTVGMVLCFYIESSWFLVSQLVFSPHTSPLHLQGP